MSPSYFKHIPRRDRAKGLVPKIRRCSVKFKRALKSDDAARQNEASHDAWNAMSLLFEILRGEQDSGHLADELMCVPTGFLATNLSADDNDAMILKQKIDRSRGVPMTLRDTLNKIAHWQITGFRVDGRNTHFLILSGTLRGKLWFAEVSVPKLCKNASAAIKGISG